MQSQAQTFTPAPNQAFALDLDTMDGNFSNWENDDLGSISGLRAVVEVPRLGKGNKWVPYFRVCVLTKDGAFGLVFEAANWKPPVVAYLLSKDKKADAIGEIGGGAKTTIDMDWGTSGKLIVRLGNGGMRELPVSSAITGVEVSASTGEFKFDSIKLGQFAH